MMLEFKPDAAVERARKRRSSRTGGLTGKDPWASTLLFRTFPEERYNIYDWQITVKPQLVLDSQESLLEDMHNNPMSPISPAFSSFSNPFAARTQGVSARPDFLSRGSSQSTSQQINTYPHAPRERPAAMMSPSPSLRSRRSDLSSQGSSMIHPMGFTSGHPLNNYTAGLTSDLPSPISTAGYETQFIEGWTSAQGRSSTLSSHTRASNSIASAVAAAAPIGATPPGPRETILDRAFQMRCIPGSERIQDKDEEKISSIARFEALMREADERKRQKSAGSIHDMKTSGWELDEESEESSLDEVEDYDPDILDMSDQDVSIPTPAQRALDYISGRQVPIPTTSRPLSPMPRTPPIPFLNTQAMSALQGAPMSSSNGLRPRTGNNSTQPSRPSSLALPTRTASVVAIPTLKNSQSSNGNLKTGDLEAKDLKRRSSLSVKRLSFTEFAKRLSSTSSLLLVQTNASSTSGRTSSEIGAADEVIARRNSIGLRGGGEIREKDKRCGWRGSVGAFGGEGGFL